MPHLHLRWSYFAAGHPVLLFNTVLVKLRRSQNFATKGNDIVDLVVAHGGQITFWSISFFAFTFSLSFFSIFVLSEALVTVAGNLEQTGGSLRPIKGEFGQFCH